jgi:flagellar protein FliS
MSYGNAAVAYRQREVLTASPAKLVVLVFDHLLVNLRRAKLATEANKIEARVEAIGKARDAVMELILGNDIEKGGELAKNLRSLYVFMFNELIVAAQKPNVARLDKLAEIATTLREGFATVAVDTAVRSPAA